MERAKDYLKGRGAQLNTANPFLLQEYVAEHAEGIDEERVQQEPTTYLPEFPRKIINKLDSPDLGLVYSMNPYQGCEHGCIYCYARNTHQYWGLSAGLDFERKIIVKENAPELLEAELRKPRWKPMPIMLSGNTDCYQPIERKKGITRKLLQVLLDYRHPVSIITKNHLVLRDLDLLTALNKYDLVHVNVSITTLNERLRRQLEPRASAGLKRLQLVRDLTRAGIPVNVMVAPIIPFLNSFEIPQLVQAVAEAGASSVAYTMVRLNGAIGDIFTDWVQQNYPDRASKVLRQIQAIHGGKLSDSRFGVRMRGEGEEAGMISRLFKVARARHMAGRSMKPLSVDHFRLAGREQLRLF
ncbi:MAG: PA0069 family radical SAM protein [Bacteroidota bacterium]